MTHALPEPQQRRDAADLAFVLAARYAWDLSSRHCHACNTHTPQRDIGISGDENDAEVLQMFVCGVCGTANSKRVPNPSTALRAGPARGE